MSCRHLKTDIQDVRDVLYRVKLKGGAPLAVGEFLFYDSFLRFFFLFLTLSFLFIAQHIFQPNFSPPTSSNVCLVVVCASVFLPCHRLLILMCDYPNWKWLLLSENRPFNADCIIVLLCLKNSLRRLRTDETSRSAEFVLLFGKSFINL